MVSFDICHHNLNSIFKWPISNKNSEWPTRPVPWDFQLAKKIQNMVRIENLEVPLERWFCPPSLFHSDPNVPRRVWMLSFIHKGKGCWRRWIYLIVPDSASQRLLCTHPTPQQNKIEPLLYGAFQRGAVCMYEWVYIGGCCRDIILKSQVLIQK